MNQYYIIKLISGSESNPSIEHIAVTDNQQAGDLYVHSMNSLFVSMETKMKHYYSVILQEWMIKHPKTRNTTDELKQWTQKQYSFQQEWIAQNLSPEEQKIIQFYSQDPIWVIEPIQSLDSITNSFMEPH